MDADRARLLANVQRAMDAAEQSARARSAGQGGLFGDLGLEAQAGAAAPFRDWLPAAPWEEHRRLREEKVALGFFLSGHLFSAHEGELRRFVKTRLADLPRIVEAPMAARRSLWPASWPPSPAP
jgi:DNA polymerase-3 subunit alpha